LDSNSKTSAYTNAVDIWSLGCVIYELLVGTHLFTSWGQVSCYYHGKSPFPEDKLKGLPTPTDDVGISLIKSMLAIKPEDRPTAVSALGNAWLTGLKSDDEDSGDDQDETTQIGDERTCNEESEGKLTTHHKGKKRRSRRNTRTQDDSKCAPGDVAFGANPRLQWDSDPTTPKSEIGTATTISPDVAPVGSSLAQKRSMNSGLAVDAPQLPGDSFRGPRGALEKNGSAIFSKHVPKVAPRMPNSTYV